MSVGIVGLGFVGNAVHQNFLQKDIKLEIYDKYKNGGIGRPEDILKTQMTFLCLPTLYLEETETYDLESMREVMGWLAEAKYPGYVVVKSTVLPGTCQRLATEFDLRVIHNPEFLTARSAVEDFANQKHIVIGLTEEANGDEDVHPLFQFYQHHYPEAEISMCQSGEAESMKIFVNSFYAMKIQIFNEFFLLTEKMGDAVNFPRVTEMMLKNGWINPMHTQVPGHDGELSYGGACFPKDTQALLAMMKQIGSASRVLDACVQERNQMRN